SEVESESVKKSSNSRNGSDDGLVGFEAHYGMKRKTAPQCYAPIGESIKPCEVDEKRGLIGMEILYGTKRKVPARCYLPKAEIACPPSGLFPAPSVGTADEKTEKLVDEGKT